METKINKSKINKNVLIGGKEYKMSKQNTNELFRKYINDISDFQTLDEKMFNNICNMSDEEKMIIILAFSNAVKDLNLIIDLHEL